MRNWRRASRSCRNVYSAKTGRMPCLFLWMWGTYVRCFLLQRPSFLGLSFILCVLFLHSTGLPDAWGDVYYSVYLTIWVMHDPLTGVLGRQPRGRGAARLQSPFPFRVFSPSPPLSSFPIPLWHKPHKLHFPTMLHKTLRDKICWLKS